MQLKSRIRLAAHLLKEDRAIARAARRMPKPVPWDWAKPRLVPLLAGPRFDNDGLEIVRATGGPGCALEIGIDLGGVFPLVDVLVAERWECTGEQLLHEALQNLDKRLAKLPNGAAVAGTLSGRIIRRLAQPRGLAASVVLLPNQLKRFFGEHDQVLAAVSRGMLVSFPINTPTEIVARTVIDLEMGEPLPLMYDPFVLVEGDLYWQPPDYEEEDFATRAREWPSA